MLDDGASRLRLISITFSSSASLHDYFYISLDISKKLILLRLCAWKANWLSDDIRNRSITFSFTTIPTIDNASINNFRIGTIYFQQASDRRHLVNTFFVWSDTHNADFDINGLLRRSRRFLFLESLIIFWCLRANRFFLKTNSILYESELIFTSELRERCEKSVACRRENCSHKMLHWKSFAGISYNLRSTRNISESDVVCKWCGVEM